ncbi:uncharacterized protein LOC126341504 [Schistocerca gregaria]|uniref:uncharacterized protein LOC126341504 n=1 Tax=Schistocerca gregaria TaxID=7010 RepID=UPI00211E5A17|nr:uncharacterized protein LOC126341504 [Schistocerca gregaria]
MDEMLEPFHGCGKFRQYIANKSAKYGIKVYALCDARMFYKQNMELYAGKQPTGPYQVPNDAGNVMLRLIRPIDKPARNMAMDNYFTSIPLANKMYANHQLTIVGTLKKNKREIPLELLDIRHRQLNGCIFVSEEKPSNN